MTHKQMSKKGGMAKSDKKKAAGTENLKKAREAKRVNAKNAEILSNPIPRKTNNFAQNHANMNL